MPSEPKDHITAFMEIGRAAISFKHDLELGAGIIFVFFPELINSRDSFGNLPGVCIQGLGEFFLWNTRR